MYCIRCGVKLAETERKCPLCETVVCHPDFPPSEASPLYPADKMPKSAAGLKRLGGVVIILFLIPLVVSFLSDWKANDRLDWAGYVAGGLLCAYVIVALPLWFARPNPVVFVPCDFAAVTAYLLYLCVATGGNWFLSFALPVAGGLCAIVTAVVALLRYVRGGRLYIVGGATMAAGGWLLLTEYLLAITFGVPFIGWSVYPLLVLALLGALMIYLGIDRVARETVERKLFF